MYKFAPQLRAKAIGKDACLAMCYIFCCGIKPDYAKYITLVSDAIDKGLLREDCYVENAAKFIFYCSGNRVKIIPQFIENIKDIVNPTPVLYKQDNGISHFVVVQKGEIVFDPLGKSVSVEKGKPVSARIIIEE